MLELDICLREAAARPVRLVLDLLAGRCSRPIILLGSSVAVRLLSKRFSTGWCCIGIGL